MEEIFVKQEEYNKRVNRILENKTKVSNSFYQIGDDLKEIKDRELYLFDCRDFQEFLKTKVAIERSTAYLAIEMRNTYTFHEFEKWGLKKLLIIKRNLKEEEDRKEFMKKFEPVRQSRLKEEINEFKLERFKNQIGKPLNDPEEQVLQFKRQWNLIKIEYDAFKKHTDAFKEHTDKIKETFIEMIANWQKVSRKAKIDKDLNSFIIEAHKILTELKNAK